MHGWMGHFPPYKRLQEHTRYQSPSEAMFALIRIFPLDQSPVPGLFPTTTKRGSGNSSVGAAAAGKG